MRQNFGRFRLCYEQGLRTNASLAGIVRMQFTIAGDGSLSSYSADGSDLPDTAVVSCVANAFSGLTFPAPESGVVKVVFPIAFSPPDDAEILRVGGVGLAQLDAAKVTSTLVSRGWRAMAVPGASDAESFVVFAVKVGASTDPIERPQGFVTSVRREEATGSTPAESRESEGRRLVAEGDRPTALLGDLIDPDAATAAKP